MPVDRGENSLFHLLAVTSSSFILFPISCPDERTNGKAPLSPSPSPSFGPQRRTIICAPILAVGTHPARGAGDIKSRRRTKR